jgi:hypothetical protein
VLAALLATAASTVAKKELEKLFAARRNRDGALSPA